MSDPMTADRAAPLPCPFCGGPSEPRDDGHVGCASRRCHFAFVSLKPAIWNTRPAETKLRERVAKLEKELESTRRAESAARARQQERAGSWDDDD